MFLIFILAAFFRLWHIEFGLPHSFYADEPEIAELAIKYTFELKDIISNNNWYKLIPISYVYGTFPTYLLTGFTIAFSKICAILTISFDKTVLYIFLRSINSLLSLLIIPTISYLYYKLFKDKLGTAIAFTLLAFNWKLISHAHYVNMDIFITILLCATYLTAYLYQEGKRDSLYTYLVGILFGLAVGTKITVLITLPLYWFIFLRKQDSRGFVAFHFLIFGTFIVTNPFSMIFASDFVFRIYSMLFKEAGLVFDSVDLSSFKYIFGLSWISTLPILILSLLGITKIKDNKGFHFFLLGNVLIYLLFYSIQSRRVDRWLLPILPIIILYASYSISSIYTSLATHKKKALGYALLGSIAFYYVSFPWTLLNQFKKDTPKSAAYLWMKDNTTIQDPFTKTLAYTEEGLDPLNKLPYADVSQFNVYESNAANLFFPKDPNIYKYVIISSRPMDNFKRAPVVRKYPNYAGRWRDFETKVTNSNNFKLIKHFETTTPNLIPLSEVSIYENTQF